MERSRAFKLPFQVQAGLADYSAMDTAELALTRTRATLGAALPGVRAQVAAMRQALVFFFGNTSPGLAQFGLKPRKKATPMSPEAKVAAKAKRAQTRTIRHTAGPKQKAAVKFTGQVSVDTQVNAPSSGAPAAAPSAGSSIPGPVRSGKQGESVAGAVAQGGVKSDFPHPAKEAQRREP